MSDLPAFINQVGEFLLFIPPINQIFFWGVATSSIFVCAMISYLNAEDDGHSKFWHMNAAGYMTVFWAINTTAWYLDSTGIAPGALKWLIISDLAFALITGLIWALQHLRWALILTLLYVGAFGLTVLTWYGLTEIPYAILSNLIYVLQLFVVSGCINYEPTSENVGYAPEPLTADLLAGAQRTM